MIMKKHKGFFYILLSVGAIALILFVTYKSQQPKLVQFDFKGKPQINEHNLANKIPFDTESFAVTENATGTIPAAPNKPISTTFATTEGAILEQITQTPTYKNIPLPVAGVPLPKAWDSKSAPNLKEVELSPSLQRSLVASASLREEKYTNPESELNLTRVEDIRAIRQKRHETE